MSYKNTTWYFDTISPNHNVIRKFRKLINWYTNDKFKEYHNAYINDRGLTLINNSSLIPLGAILFDYFDTWGIVDDEDVELFLFSVYWIDSEFSTAAMSDQKINIPVSLGKYDYGNNTVSNRKFVQDTKFVPTYGSDKGRWKKFLQKIGKEFLIKWVTNNVTERAIESTYKSWITGDGFAESFSKALISIYKSIYRDEDSRDLFTEFTWSDTTFGQFQINFEDFASDFINGTNIIGSGDSKVDLLAILGFDDWQEENGGLTDFTLSLADVASLKELERLFKDDPSQFSKIAVAAKGEKYKSPTNEQIINLRQCALMTELLHYPSSSGRNFSQYFRLKNYNSPLSNSSGIPHDSVRIYPVYNEYDSTALSNLINISPQAKTTLEIKDPKIITKNNYLNKQLCWVYPSSSAGEFGEAIISLGSKQANQEKKENLDDLGKALAIWNSTGLTEKQKKKNLGNLGISIANEAAYKTKLAQYDAQIKKLYNPETNSTNIDSYYYLENMEINFDGTNPSTTRKDVKVTMKFWLSSMQALQNIVTTIQSSDLKGGTNDGESLNIYLSDLITLPNTNKLTKGPGSWLKNQYNPEYSRVRLKVYTKNSTKSDLIIDLTTIDHQLTRSSEDGSTSLSITYRGFFETMLDMPFNDALADDGIITAREKISNDIVMKIKKSDCDASIVAQSLKLEQEIYKAQNSATAGSLLKRLADKGLIHAYSLDENLLIANSVNGTLDPYYNYVTSAGRLQDHNNVVNTAINNVITLEKQKKSKEQQTEIAKNLIGRFFFLGDLMHVVSDCLYDQGTANMRDVCSSMNMRFLVGTIALPHPKNYDEKIIVNPACFPIDLRFFTEWFNATIVNKGISTYPVGVFIRDIIDRMINNIIYDVCFSTLPPGESAPIIRTQIASDFGEDGWFKVDALGWFQPEDPFGNGMERLPLFVRDAKQKSNPKNYMIIYQQFPAFSLNKKSIGQEILKDSKYVPTIFFGTKNIKFNYLSNVSFAKTNSQFLREARYFNNNYGNLSLLSNVYDLNFSFNRRLPTTFLYPGVIINFILLDWNWSFNNESPYTKNSYEHFGENNPHDKEKLAHILGFGGYYVIKSVTYKLDQIASDWTIDITTKFMGTDAKPNPTRTDEQIAELEAAEDKCFDLYQSLVGEARAAGVGEEAIDLDILSERQPSVRSNPNDSDSDNDNEEKVTEVEEIPEIDKADVGTKLNVAHVDRIPKDYSEKDPPDNIKTLFAKEIAIILDTEGQGSFVYSYGGGYIQYDFDGAGNIVGKWWSK